MSSPEDHNRSLSERETLDSTTASPASTSTLVPLIEERLQIEKAIVDRGGYRITKVVETHDVPIHESLRIETLEVERRAVGRRLADDEVPMVRHEGDVTIVPVVEEVLVTEKRRVLTEEIRITKIVATREFVGEETLRSDRVHIERVAAAAPADDALLTPGEPGLITGHWPQPE